MNDSALLRLDPRDNVLTIVRAVKAGASLDCEGVSVQVPRALGIGHKIAARSIGAGEKVVKYGVPIGSATRAIAFGEHVHTHNLQSDYLPTWSRETQREWFAAGERH